MEKIDETEKDSKFSYGNAFSDAGICGLTDLTYAAGRESIAIAVPAEKEGIGRYYYKQFPDEAKGLYLAMYNMYEQGILKTGTGDYDLVANGHFLHSCARSLSEQGGWPGAAYTEILYNPSGTYTPPPYVKRAPPSNTTRIYIGKMYHMTLQYDENLKWADEGTEPGIHVSVLEENSTALDYCKVGNFKWNGTDTVEFDFTPSEMWLDESVSYIFETTGLIGVDSEKAPKSTSYEASYKETDAMNGLIEDTFPQDNVLKSETYNISILVCRQSIVSLGTSIRLSVGFPKGYGPDDEGVTFKEYHFKRDKYGENIYCGGSPLCNYALWAGDYL